MNGVFNYYTSEFLNKIKEKYKVHYIVFLIDPISGFPSDFMKNNLFNTKYDLLYSFDYNDAQQLNAIHSMCIYSKQLIHNNGNYQGGGILCGYQ